jgi:hypothetical protein
MHYRNQGIVTLQLHYLYSQYRNPNTNIRRKKPQPWKFTTKLKRSSLSSIKKHLMKHGGQVIKQVLKPERIFERLVLLKPITQEKSQHNGIGSHLFYLNMHHCNVSLDFDKIQLAIVKCSQSISLIFSV